MKPQNIGFDEDNTAPVAEKPVQAPVNQAPAQSNHEPATGSALPSGNWFPLKGLPSGRTDMYGRPLTYREIKKLSYANDDTIDEALMGIAKDAIVAPQSGEHEIFDCDLRYAFLWLRTNSMLDPRFDMTYTCTECAKDVSFKLEPSDIETVDNEPTNGKTEAFVKDGFQIIIGFPTASRMVEAKKLEALYADAEDIEIDAMVAGHVLHVSNEGGFYKTPKEIYEWMDTQNPDLILRIHEIAKKYMRVGLVETVKQKCPHCQKELVVDLDMTSVFFFPTV